MSDVPALAAWLLALALASRTFARCAGRRRRWRRSLAILIRPNLAPLVLVVAWQAWQTAPPVAAKARRLTVARPLVVVAAALAGVAAVAAVQASLYGSPLQSGYGRASELFALRYVPENLAAVRGLAPAKASRGRRASFSLAGAACLAWCAVRARRLAPAGGHGSSP